MDIFTPLTLTLEIGRFLFKHQDQLWPVLKAGTAYRARPMRVSMAAIVKLELEGRFLLVRSHHRPELFVPFGGVFKHFAGANTVLNDLEFETQRSFAGSEDLPYDLRGFLPSRNFPSFMAWFRSRADREEKDCLTRELSEELIEAGVATKRYEMVRDYRLALLRRVREGPSMHPSGSFAQFRYMEVYEPTDSEMNREITEELFGLGSENDNLLVVSRKEIDRCRSVTGKPIGSHAHYFFSSRLRGPEPAEIV